MRQLFVISAAVLAVCLVSSGAWACSCIPETRSELVFSSVMPVNARGLEWRTNWESSNPQGVVTVVEVVDGDELPVEFTFEGVYERYVIRPTNWAEGKTYRVRVEPIFDMSMLPGTLVNLAEFTVGPALPENIAIRLNVDEVLEQEVFLPVSTGECELPYNAVTSNVSTKVDGAAGVFRYEVYVNDRAWSPIKPNCGYLPQGPFRNLVAICDGDKTHPDALKPGVYEIHMTATLVPSGPTFTTETAQVDLRCPGMQDMADAGADQDPTELVVSPPPRRDDDAGCGSVKAGGDVHWVVFVLLGLGVTCRRRRDG
ncbi:MAG: hypothetical protein R3E66_01880 [bacterium]